MALPQIRAQTRRSKVRSPAAQGGNQLLFPLQELPRALSPPVGREMPTSRRNPPSGGSAQCSCAPCSFWGQLPAQLLGGTASSQGGGSSGDPRFWLPQACQRRLERRGRLLEGKKTKLCPDIRADARLWKNINAFPGPSKSNQPRELLTEPGKE